MKKVLFIFLLLLVASTVQAQYVREITEEDGAPACYGYSVKFPNSTVTDNGDGTCSVVVSVTDDQTIDVFSISGDNVQLSLESDGEATKTVDISTTTAVTANTAKNTNVPTALSAGTINATTYAITSDGGADDIVLPEADTTNAGLLGSDKWDEIVANSLKVTDDDIGVAEVYDATGWDNDTGSPQKNDVRDKIETLAPKDSPTFTTAADAPTPAADDNDTSVATTAYVQGEINGAGGARLTCGSGTCAPDAEIYTKTVCMPLETPTSADNFLMYYVELGAQITGVDCIVEDATSATIEIEQCDVAGDNCTVVTTAIVCDVGGQADDGTIDNPDLDVTDWIRLDVTATVGTPGHVTVCVHMEMDD